MKPRLLRAVFLLTLAPHLQPAVSPAAPQQQQDSPPYGELEKDPKLPNGKSQRDEVLKLEREENIRDAAKLIELSQSLKADLEVSDRFVVSMKTIKKTDEIDKLVKTIRDRLRH